jgi:hypothetical protein
MPSFTPKLVAVLLVLWTGILPLSSETIDRQPKDVPLSSHVFPALGSVAERKVAVEWNRFHDHAGLGSILAQLHQAFPQLTRLYSLGTSYGGRDLWCLEITAPNTIPGVRKPGFYIDGNIHGNEVQAAEVVAYTAWYLCHQYEHLDKVTELLNQSVFYLVPTINPDGRDRWFHDKQPVSRSGSRPYDNDRDGLVDEDDFEDINGDGFITEMRIKDPNGKWKPHPDYPDYLMVRVAPGERGEYTLLGLEGIDNDGDGKVNEDPVGGYDMNRDWGYDWQPRYIQPGALEYPFCLKETRALSDFILQHPNIAGFQSYHNAGGMILRSPGREGGAISPQDENVMRTISERGEKMLPFYRPMTIWKDLYTVWGGEIDWLYAGRGILGFTTELWTPRNITKNPNGPSQEEESAFIKYVLMNDAVVKWKEFNHPTYGKIEIGGLKKEWGRTPMSFLLEEECHRNMAFTLYHADQMPRLSIREITSEKLDDNLFKIWVTIDNTRLIPTRTGQDVKNHISAPDVVTLQGSDVKVISSGQVIDPYFKKVKAVKQRPDRVELDTIPGMDDVCVQFIVSGKGTFKIQVDSAKGGLIAAEHVL